MDYLKSHLGLSAIITLVIIVLLLAGYLAFSKGQLKQNNGKKDQQISERQLNVRKEEVKKDQLPKDFPANLPIEEGATITQNYNATSADGTFQATRVFETKKSLDENYKIYQNYLQANGWKIQADLKQDNYQMLLGVKEGSSLQVSINKNSVNGISTVDISYSKSLVKKESNK